MSKCNHWLEVHYHGECLKCRIDALEAENGDLRGAKTEQWKAFVKKIKRLAVVSVEQRTVIFMVNRKLEATTDELDNAKTELADVKDMLLSSDDQANFENLRVGNWSTSHVRLELLGKLASQACEADEEKLKEGTL